jgi:hypothetical protein
LGKWQILPRDRTPTFFSSPFSSPELDTFLPGDERKSSAQLQEKGFGLTQNSVLSCTIPAERLELPIARS